MWEDVSHLFVLFVYEHASDGDAVSSILHCGHGGVEEHGGGDDDDDVLGETRYAHDHARSVADEQQGKVKEDEGEIEKRTKR